MRFRFSRRARADIEEIGDFIAGDDPLRAVAFIAEMRAHCRRLVAFPDAAPLLPGIGEGVRMAVLGRYLILYVVHHPDLLEIRRVVHGARDLDGMLT
jgi:toxin ParE1/3/4